MAMNKWTGRRPRGRLLAGCLVLLGVVGLGVLAPGQAAAQDQGGAYLGVVLQNLDSSLRDSYGYRGPGGVLVGQVEPGSPADRAHVRAGDILIRVEGRTVNAATDVSREIRSRRPGDDVDLTLWRDGEEMHRQVELKARSEANMPRDDQSEPGNDEEAPPQMGDQGDMSMPTPEMAMRPRLGIQMEDAQGDEGGVRVTRVLPNTAAARAGLRTGDIIIEVEGRSIDRSADLSQELERHGAGPVRLTIMRDDRRRTVTADLPAVDTQRRMVIRRMNPNMATPGMGSDEREQLRREMDDLRRQMDDLRRQVEDLRRQLNLRGRND